MPVIATAPQIIEGIWEEVLRQCKKLNGHRVRVEILPDHKTATPPNTRLLNLFKEWKEEDAKLSPEEIAQNRKMYEEIEKNGIPRISI